MHTERHLSSFTDELSTRREWLIGHQPSITETISMKPDGRRRDAQGNLPPELMSDDGLMSALTAQPKPEANPSQKKPAWKRHKKLKRTGNQQPVSDKTVTPTVSGTAANPPATVKKATNGRPKRTYIPLRNPPRGQVATRDGESYRRRDSKDAKARDKPRDELLTYREKNTATTEQKIYLTTTYNPAYDGLRSQVLKTWDYLNRSSSTRQIHDLGKVCETYYYDPSSLRVGTP